MGSSFWTEVAMFGVIHGLKIIYIYIYICIYTGIYVYIITEMGKLLFGWFWKNIKGHQPLFGFIFQDTFGLDGLSQFTCTLFWLSGIYTKKTI